MYTEKDRSLPYNCNIISSYSASKVLMDPDLNDINLHTSFRSVTVINIMDSKKKCIVINSVEINHDN